MTVRKQIERIESRLRLIDSRLSPLLGREDSWAVKEVSRLERMHEACIDKWSLIDPSEKEFSYC